MIRWMLCVAVALIVGSHADAAWKVSIAADHADGIYKTGDSVQWTIRASDGESNAPSTIRYSILKGGLDEFASGELALTDGGASLSASRDEPGLLLLVLKYPSEEDGKEALTYGAAAFAPEKIQASATPPDDFDAFWKDKIAALQSVPMEVVVEAVDIGNPNVEYFKITMNNIGGTKIYGQLAKPRGQSDLPAILQVQWAGVYPLHRDWVVGLAQGGWLALNISAHDLPIDETDAFYEAKSKNELNDYPGMGNDDRETSYFLRMFLSCYRSAQYLTERSDWNKKSLVVQGGSQGGYQTIVTAGLHPAVTAIAANVPAGCDQTGKQAGRAPGWPQWASRTWQGKSEAKMVQASRYYDAMNFAKRVKCPALIGIGLIDKVCPAEGVFATCNQFLGERELVVMPAADHFGDHKAYYEAYGRFLNAHKR